MEEEETTTTRNEVILEEEEEEETTTTIIEVNNINTNDNESKLEYDAKKETELSTYEYEMNINNKLRKSNNSNHINGILRNIYMMNDLRWSKLNDIFNKEDDDTATTSGHNVLETLQIYDG